MINPKALQETLVTTDFLHRLLRPRDAPDFAKGRNKEILATPSGCPANAGYSSDRALSEQARTYYHAGEVDRGMLGDNGTTSPGI